MKELQDMIIANFNEKVESGKLKEIIDKKTDAMINDMLDNCLRSYSDFSKAFQKKFEQEMTIRLSEMSFTQYADIVTKTILRRVEAGTFDLQKDVTEKNMKGFLEKLLDPPPEKIRLSDIVEQYIENVKEESEGSGEIGFALTERSSSAGFTHYTVYLSEKGPLTKSSSRYDTDYSDKYTDYDLQLRLIESDGKVTLSGISPRFGKPIEESFFTKERFGFEKLLFNMFCRGTLIELDEADVSVEWDNYG